MNILPIGLALLCGGVLFLLLFIGGLILVLNYNRNKKRAGSSQQWPFVQGMITVSEIKQNSSSDEDGNMSYSYTPKIEFNYVVNGQSFTGKQVAFGAVRGYNVPAQAQEQANRYPVNTAVWVFYNPQNPSEAVLERAESSGNKTALIIGIVLMVLSVLISCPLLIVLLINTK